MSNKYSKWNMATTYKRRNQDVIDVFKGQEICFFQYRATRVYLLDTYINCCHSPLDSIDFEILERVIASRVIVVEQLYCYLYLQGIDVNIQELIQRLQILHSKGMVRKGIIINGKRKTFINYTYFENMEFYEPTRAGVDFLRSKEVNGIGIRHYSKGWTNISWQEYVRSGIMWNQIVLKLLLRNDEITNFNIQFLYKNHKSGIQNIYIPLLINTKNRIYVFEFVRGIDVGRTILEKKWQQWKKQSQINGRTVNVVFLCENEYHMEMMVVYFKEIVDENVISIYFTHDELWFGTDKGNIKKLCLSEGILKKSTIK